MHCLYFPPGVDVEYKKYNHTISGSLMLYLKKSHINVYGKQTLHFVKNMADPESEIQSNTPHTRVTFLCLSEMRPSSSCSHLTEKNTLTLV